MNTNFKEVEYMNPIKILEVNDIAIIVNYV
jgi:hypothetical protein